MQVLCQLSLNKYCLVYLSDFLLIVQSLQQKDYRPIDKLQISAKQMDINATTMQRRASHTAIRSSLDGAGGALLDTDTDTNTDTETGTDTGSNAATGPRLTVVALVWSLLCRPLVPALIPVVTSAWFDWTVTFVVVVNTGVLACDRYPLAAATAEIYEDIGFVCTVFFCGEMLVKVAALGITNYALDWYNVFDSVIVGVSAFDLYIAPPAMVTGHRGYDSGGSNGGLTAFRTFRLVRILKVLRQFGEMQNIFLLIGRMLPVVGGFCVLLILFMYIFVLIGMQLFANTFRFDADGYVVLRNTSIPSGR
jgi:hypothetical protein